MSNLLPILANEIRLAHREADEAAKSHVECVLKAGRALNEAKVLVQHGQWMPFLQEAGIPERTAQRYMVLAASGLESDTVSLLGGISPALRFIGLRQTAIRHFDNAEAACLKFAESGEGEEHLLPPIEWAMHAIDEMAGMFPQESSGEVRS